jgi:YggT family protein
MEIPMLAIVGLLDLILGVLFFFMVVHIVMSWLLNFQVLNIHQPIVSQIYYGLRRLLEPLYEPVRRILPDTRPLDLAPLVIFILVIWLRNYVLPMLA